MLSRLWSAIARFGKRGVQQAKDGAYYLNLSVPAVARIADGIRPPAGRWIRVAGAEARPDEAQEIARKRFPVLADATLYVFTLGTGHDVEDFERCFGARGFARSMLESRTPADGIVRVPTAR